MAASAADEVPRPPEAASAGDEVAAEATFVADEVAAEAASAADGVGAEAADEVAAAATSARPKRGVNVGESRGHGLGLDRPSRPVVASTRPQTRESFTESCTEFFCVTTSSSDSLLTAKGPRAGLRATCGRARITVDRGEK